MKIDINLAGRPASASDYDTLRAALVAAQAATPTAVASRGGLPPLEPHDALAQLLAGSGEDVASTLTHRFAPGLETCEPGDD